MSRIKVLVATTEPDIKAEGIAAAISSRADMALVRGRVVKLSEVGPWLDSLRPTERCALVLVCPHSETEEHAANWLAKRINLVVLRVDLIDDVVHIDIRDIGLDSLLTELGALVERAGSPAQERAARLELRSTFARHQAIAATHIDAQHNRTLFNAAIDWLHAVLRNAVAQLADGKSRLLGLGINVEDLLAALGERRLHAAPEIPVAVLAADEVLTQALAAADAQTERLAAAAKAFELSPVEFRTLLLTLAPEIDSRYQRCMGVLLDEMSRRVGTLGLYAALLGEPSQVRHDLALAGNLLRWRVIEGQQGAFPPADEPLRVDPSLAAWLLGESSALDNDPHVRRALRLARWPGASLLDRAEVRVLGATLLKKLQQSSGVQWVLLGRGAPPAWRALLELGAKAMQSSLIRVEIARLAGMDVISIEESGLRLGRMARLTGRALVIDATASDGAAQEDDWLQLFFESLSNTGCRVAIISNDEARILQLLGSASYELFETAAVSVTARIAAVRASASGADVFLSEDVAEAIANQYPLEIDRLEQAMRLARSRPLSDHAEKPHYERFIAACKAVASKGMSGLAERIEPIFKIDDVVLPSDQKQQLLEIVDSIRLAPRVLDGWKFRDQMPYGRGVTALFHGHSGTGKTMAAMGVARKLGIQILRIDLSRVVSKYIGDTEKNIDRVFNDAQNSGSAILIDEAEALLGKRSEVKDAHDRYANIEVAYLLQRMEEYEGLAIFTTNLRQNLDAAFLRRLRFVIDFPRPDIEAREKIWRRCLPEGSHAIDGAEFRQLARGIDLTGGHIRQITLRAAFIAAAANTTISLEHISYAARAEFAKLGMPPVEILAQRRRVA